MSAQEERLTPGSIAELGAWLEKFGAERVILVRGENSYRQSGAEAGFQAALKGKLLKEFVRPSLLVKAEELDQLADDIRSFAPQIIVAVGGGAVIDSAKIMAALASVRVSASEMPWSDFSEVPLVPLVAVPTTAGTGSESTSFAALYVNGIKHSIKAAGLLPKLAIVDVNLTKSLPAYETACTGFDALCQSIESHWSRSSSEESRKYSKQAISMAASALSDAVQSGSVEARAQMCQSAHLSGKAINLTGTTGPHAFSYGLTYDYGIAHGHAVAMTIRQFFRFNSNSDGGQDFKFEGETSQRIEEICQALGASSVSEAVVFLGNLMESCGVTRAFAELGIGQDQIETLCRKVDPVRLANNPRTVQRTQFVQFFQEDYLC